MTIEEKILELYHQNKNVGEIKKLLNVGNDKIAKTLKDNNLQHAHKIKHAKLEQDIIQLYNSGKNLKEVSKLLKVQKNTVKRHLRTNKIEIRQKIKKYNFNRSYFKNIDTEDKAYILGWIISRAGMNDTSINIFVEHEQEFMIDVVKKYIGECGVQKNDVKIKISLYSQEMTDDFEKLGILENKVKSHSPFPKINDNLLRHFVRGYFEAINLKLGGSYEIRLYQNDEFLIEMQKYLESKNIKSYFKDNLYITGKSELLKFKEFIYNDCTLMWQEAFDKFDFIKEREEQIIQRKIELENKKELEQQEIDKKVRVMYDTTFLGAKKIAKKLNISFEKVKESYKRLKVDTSIPRLALRVKKKCANCYAEKQLLEFRREGSRHASYCFVCEELKYNITYTIGLFLRTGKIYRNGFYLKYLPYTLDELKAHIESLFEPWMNWNNRGYYFPHKWDDNDQSTWFWSIDHIIPQSDLKYTSYEDENFKKCWALENLRPYSSKQNVLDGVSRVRHTNKFGARRNEPEKVED